MEERTGAGAGGFGQLSVLTAIREMAEARRRANIVPDHVLLLTLRARMAKEGMAAHGVIAALTGLRDAGKVKIGRTVNDWYIRIIDERGTQ